MPVDESQWWEYADQLSKRVRKGDAKAHIAKHKDDVARLNWTNVIDDAILEYGLAKYPHIHDSIKPSVSRMKRLLLGESPTAMDRLLVDRIGTCWLHLYVAEMHYAEFLANGGAFQKGEYYQKSVDRAQKRYLGAIKALAQVRKLLGGPDIAILNVAGTQNVKIDVIERPSNTSPDTTSDNRVARA